MSACTLSNPVWRKRSIVFFAFMGGAGLLLTIITYEHTPDALHLGDIVQIIAGRFLQLLGTWQFKIGGALIIGFIAFPIMQWVIKIYSPVDKLEWVNGPEIFHLCDSKLVQTARSDAERLRALELEDKNIQAENFFCNQTGPFANPDQTELERTEKLDELKRRMAELYPAMSDAKTKRNISYAHIESDLYEKLINGNLVAKGFLAPINPYSEELLIPSARWRFLRFANELRDASGEDMTYKAVSVARPK